jgi:Flp pilus assembly protein TadD
LPRASPLDYDGQTMRWIASLALFLVLTGVARAISSDDQYLNIYNEVLQADALKHDGQNRAAAIKYAEAQTRLQKLKSDFPDWNNAVVTFRLQYLSNKLQEIGKDLPPSTTPAAPVVAPPAAAPPAAAFAQQIAALQEQVRTLTEEKGELENKVKEALSVQPAAVSPAEMAKRDAEIVALKKEKDLLTVDLEQAKSAKATAADASNSKLAADLAAAKDQSREANEKLEQANRELAAAKTASGDATQITQERDKLKEELAARTKDLADAEAHGDQEAITLRAQLKEAAAARDDLQKKLDAATASAADTSELEQLRSRVAALDAKAVPYTPEELAILNQAQTPPSTLPAPAPAAAASAGQTAAAPAKKPHTAHSAMELPPGAGALMADALRASMERDYARAEEKYQQILRQDENNVYVLTYLANAQFAQGHLEECGKTVDRALALDPDEPATLYLLGILRYRQEKLDEALNALSRSAQLNATNPGTQNYLGCVLADKGMRPAAETAFRKALQLEPDYPDAHYNLAFIYATEKPPSPELARWHYKKAVDLGHPKNEKLEEILGGAK